jgi:hypothetical protein
MPIDCFISSTAEQCRWSVGYIWRSSDWIERGIFISFSLILAYAVLVLCRFVRLCYFNRTTSSTSAKYLSRELPTLKAIAAEAPFLGLAGTGYGILGGMMSGVFFGYSGTPERYFAIIITHGAASLLTTAAGILVAIPSVLVHNFVHARIEQIEWDKSAAQTSPRGDGDSSAVFRRAQSLPLRKRFSSLPPFALIAAPVLAAVVCMFMAFEPYERPVGLGVRLLHIGPYDDRPVPSKPVLITLLRPNASGSPVMLINSSEATLDRLDTALGPRPEPPDQRKAYLEAAYDLQWAEVLAVIDDLNGLDADVTLLTTAPDTRVSPRK